MRGSNSGGIIVEKRRSEAPHPQPARAVSSLWEWLVMTLVKIQLPHLNYSGSSAGARKQLQLLGIKKDTLELSNAAFS